MGESEGIILNINLGEINAVGDEMLTHLQEKYLDCFAAIAFILSPEFNT